MFYSQTFLARKGPLGTVWCAAHLQHRLRKSHYTSTDIISTVDRIMFPEVPIALRMSSHLLLGVVRIYSKKVEYLVHDCNLMLVTLKRTFAPADVTLPEKASTARAEAITLPPVLDFDALDIDTVCLTPPKLLDNHLVSRDDITLASVVPHDRDQYIAVTFDDNVDVTEDTPISGDFPPPEILREQNPVSTPVQLYVEHDLSKEKEPIHLEVRGDMNLPQAYLDRRNNSDSESPPPFDPAFESLSLKMADRPASPIEAATPLQSSPLQRRKRKPQFDKDPVLKNKFMRLSLIETNDLKRNKRTATSSLCLWRCSKKTITEGIFSGSSLSGLTNKLTNILNSEYTLAQKQPPLSPPSAAEETNTGEFSVPATVEASTVPSTAAMDEDPFSTLRDSTNEGRGFWTSPSKSSSLKSTPSLNDTVPSFASVKSSDFGSTRTGLGSTDSRLGSTNWLDFDGRLPDIPEATDGLESEDLFFLNNDQSPSGSEEGGGNGSLTVRTRAVAQYLCNNSSARAKTRGTCEKEISLNEVLDGKRASICARMFYEILVLKNCGMLDLSQENVYDDIKLILTPAISKA